MQISFLKEETPAQDGFYWYRHKDSDATEIGCVRGGFCMTCLPPTKSIHREDWDRYLWSDALPVPHERPLAVQMAVEADDNRMVKPSESLMDALNELNDPKDWVSKSNKSIVIALYDEGENYHIAAWLCNLARSEAVALLTIKASQYAAEIVAAKHEP